MTKAREDEYCLLYSLYTAGTIITVSTTTTASGIKWRC